MELFDLSQFGVAIFSMGVLSFVIKKFLCFMKHQEENFNKIITNHLTESSKASKELEQSHLQLSMTIRELLSFLRKSNGK